MGKLKTSFSFVYALTFHYFCCTKIGCGSAIKISGLILYCFRLSLFLHNQSNLEQSFYQ